MCPFEPEEFVGQCWHRLVGNAASYRGHPGAEVRLEEVRGRLGVLFRAFGGDGAIRVAPAAATSPGHRLSLRAAIGLGTERLRQPALDATTLHLPAVIDLLPDREANALLYEWLAGWFAHAAPPAPGDGDPLRRDVLRLRAAIQATRAAQAAWPGLARHYARLRAAFLDIRPRRALPRAEREVEAAILALLRDETEGGPGLLRLILDADAPLDGLRAPTGYRTYLPVPLWGEVLATGAGSATQGEEPGGNAVAADAQRRRAARRSTEQSERGDPLLLHRFETLLSLAEMVNVNRPVDDDDEDSARQAAEELPELTIGSNRRRAATRLRMDLELAPAEAEAAPLQAEHLYPEWDWKRGRHHPAHCRVVAGPAPEHGEEWAPDMAMRRRIRQVRRQFEALHPRRVAVRGQPDGDELDLAALVRGTAERRAGRAGPERLFISTRPAMRDLSVAVLMDASLSTDTWIGALRVLDVEKAALLALTHGLTACGDEHAIYAFTSRRRGHVAVSTVKGFDEPLSGVVTRRIAALRPGQYTRIGAALRHVARGLAERPHRHRLLLLLTDGKPNDIDHYEGRYGMEDSRMAVREARQAGLRVFGVTVDEHARDYVPYMFGRGAYAIVPDPARLPAALPAIYRQITQ